MGAEMSAPAPPPPPPTLLESLAETDPLYAIKWVLIILAVLKLDSVATNIARYVPGYNLIINAAAPFLVPLFVTISPLIKPLYIISDILLLKNGKDPKRPSASSPSIVVFCSRTINGVEGYKAEFSKYATSIQTSGKGVRAAFSFIDKDKKDTALQLFWFDGPSDFVKQPSSLEAFYSGTPKTDYCQIWGGFDDAFKKNIETKKCKYSFVKEVRGFLREANAANAGGFKSGGDPMIWISKRPIKKGRMGKCGKNFQAGTDMMYPNAPAALGICEFTDPDDDHSSWSLRVFNHYEYAFKAHFPVPSWILFRMVFNVIPEWVPGLFPIGFSFSAKKDIEKAVASNGGNAAYKQYYWDKDIIGPKPDFAKGF